MMSLQNASVCKELPSKEATTLTTLHFMQKARKKEVIFKDRRKLVGRGTHMLKFDWGCAAQMSFLFCLVLLFTKNPWTWVLDSSKKSFKEGPF